MRRLSEASMAGDGWSNRERAHIRKPAGEPAGPKLGILANSVALIGVVGAGRRLIGARRRA